MVTIRGCSRVVEPKAAQKLRDFLMNLSKLGNRFVEYFAVVAMYLPIFLRLSQNFFRRPWRDADLTETKMHEQSSCAVYLPTNSVNSRAGKDLGSQSEIVFHTAPFRACGENFVVKEQWH